MTSARRSPAMIVAPLLGLLVGGVAGYLVAQGLHQGPVATVVDHSTELAEIRTELTELKAQIAPAASELAHWPAEAITTAPGRSMSHPCSCRVPNRPRPLAWILKTPPKHRLSQLL